MGLIQTINETKLWLVNADRIREHAERERWSNRKIARETGLSKEGVSRILNGEVDPGASKLKQICDVIGFPIEEAFVEKSAT